MKLLTFMRSVRQYSVIGDRNWTVVPSIYHRNVLISLSLRRIFLPCVRGGRCGDSGLANAKDAMIVEVWATPLDAGAERGGTRPETICRPGRGSWLT